MRLIALTFTIFCIALFTSESNSQILWDKYNGEVPDKKIVIKESDLKCKPTKETDPLDLRYARNIRLYL